MSFYELSKKFNLHTYDLIHLFVLSDKALSLESELSSRPLETLVECLLALDPERRRLIYSFISSAIGGPSGQRILGSKSCEPTSSLWATSLTLGSLLQRKAVHKAHCSL